MTPTRGSDWLRESGYKSLPHALCSLRPRDAPRLIRPIQRFDGTKVMVACTGATPLEAVVKQALCLANKVILVPAPLWNSCDAAGATEWPEFNFESITSAGCYSASLRVLDNVGRLMEREAGLFEDGSVTFLPLLGDTPHRWNHADLLLPEFPRAGADPSTVDVRRDALYGLLSERLAAERLGAVHMNVASFKLPVLGDFVFTGPDEGGNLRYSLVDLAIPDPTCLAFHSIRRISDEVPALISMLPELSGATAGDCVSALTDWTRRFEAARAATGCLGRSRSIAIGCGGPAGSAMAAARFLLRGGSVDRLTRVVAGDGRVRLEIQPGSIFATG